MMNANISLCINQRFECPECHASGNWIAITRVMSWHSSTIQAFGCRRCGEEVVVKVPRATSASENGEQPAQKEYRVLCELQRTFPQDNQFGTLTPLGYFELDGYGAIITKKFVGVDLVRYTSGLADDRRHGLFRPAGILLRKLHDSCPRGYEPESLGVEGKVDYLARSYGGELRADPAARTLIERFEQESARVSALVLRATWSHGDFKPENVLCDGHKYLILDTELDGYAAFVYDIASFLDHLLIAGGAKNSGIKHCYQQAEDDFLAGYGGLTEQELVALRWAQLYFMLHYWGRYRRRGPLSAMYANWKIRPLVQKVAAKLQEV